MPSAWDWASTVLVPPRGLAISAGKYRSPDASLRQCGDFIVRRIAPDARKLYLKDVRRNGRGTPMLRAMAADLAAIHAATCKTDAIRDDLEHRRKGWLLETAKAAKEFVEEDLRVWRASRRATRDHRS